MTPEEQRIAIATAVPQKFVGLRKRGMWYRPNSAGYTLCECDAGRYTMEQAKRHEYLIGEPFEHVTIKAFSTPDYLNDWNTRPQMLARMTGAEKRKMVRWACGGFGDVGDDITATDLIIILELDQKEFCELFLRTLGKWVEQADGEMVEK